MTEITPSINDISIKIATVNGSGSASANNLLAKSIMRMGVPFSTKNLFPSNIQGRPTWYEIRANEKGFVARRNQFDLMVAMNAQTLLEDEKEVKPGGYYLYDNSWPMAQLTRQDINVIGVPISSLCAAHFHVGREAILMKNIVYVGAIAALLAIDLELVKNEVKTIYRGKESLIDKNFAALQLGFDYVVENLSYPLPTKLQKCDLLKNKILIDGNTAAAIGCVYAGATVAAWYPITPSTSLMDAFEKYCKKYRVDPEAKKNNFCFIQAEDEMAAIGITLGAGWNGVRAFTSTSGPGISLMSELIGLGYFAEVPMVIFDIQRGGPSTGLPTRTQQGDILTCAYCSHGDTKHVVLFPHDPRECFEMSLAAFDLAELIQSPVFVLSDLDIGMNAWICDELTFDDNYQHQRGKHLSTDEINTLEKIGRYIDRDGDGICPRLLPGITERGAFLTRGTLHNELGFRTEEPTTYFNFMNRLTKKFETIKSHVPKPIIQYDKKNRHAIIAVGSSDIAIQEVLYLLGEKNIHLNYMRIRAFPFCEEVEDFISQHDTIYVVEQNRDAQLRSLLLLESNATKQQLIAILQYNSMPISTEDVLPQILHHEEGVPCDI